MDFSKDIKIARFAMKDMTVTRRKHESDEQIKFCVNDVKFTTHDSFKTEKDFMDIFLNGEKICCYHYFEATVIDCEDWKMCNLCYKNGFVTVFVI